MLFDSTFWGGNDQTCIPEVVARSPGIMSP